MSIEETIHLYVEAGPDSGRQITVPTAGARIGRTDNNDIVISDPSLSRFHCRVYFKDSHLWVADLGSTNETEVNHKAVHESILNAGDRLTIGDTTMLVINDLVDGSSILPPKTQARPPEAPAPSRTMPEPARAAVPDLGLGKPAELEPGPKPEADPNIDLGFGPRPAESSSGPRKLMWAVIFLAVLLVSLLAVKKLIIDAPGPRQAGPKEKQLDIYYEKVQASTNNIFRYELTLADKRLSVRIDNLQDGRQTAREKKVDQDLIDSLARTIEEEGYYGLKDEYSGIARNVHDVWDLTVTINNRSKRVVVSNRIEPEEFKRIRTIIEEYAQNELDIMAIALPPEKLKELAKEAFMNGQKFMAERDVRHQNLFEARQAFKEAMWHLETIEPKPEYYPDAVGGFEDCKTLLQDRYDSNMFQAERAVVLKDWEDAAQQLRIILEMIPDRGDDRHKKAEIKLIDVGRHLKR